MCVYVGVDSMCDWVVWVCGMGVSVCVCVSYVLMLKHYNGRCCRDKSYPSKPRLFSLSSLGLSVWLGVTVCVSVCDSLSVSVWMKYYVCQCVCISDTLCV